MPNNSAKYVIIIGAAILFAGIIIYFFPNAFKWFGRLPGDIRIEKENSGFYFPIVTMIVVSVIITIIVNVIKKFF